MSEAQDKEKHGWVEDYGLYRVGITLANENGKYETSHHLVMAINIEGAIEQAQEYWDDGIVDSAKYIGHIIFRDDIDDWTTSRLQERGALAKDTND